jgi:hypothetical protein
MCSCGLNCVLGDLCAVSSYWLPFCIFKGVLLSWLAVCLAEEAAAEDEHSPFLRTKLMKHWPLLSLHMIEAHG